MTVGSPVRPIEDKPQQIRAGSLDPGSYRLRVTGTARGGKLRFDRPLQAEVEVEVWNRSPSSLAAHESSADGHLLVVTTRVGEAAEKGLKCGVYLSSERRMRLGRVEVPAGLRHAQLPRFNDTPGAELAMVEWQTDPLAAFSELTAKVELRGEPQAGWEELLTHVDAKCSTIS